MSKRIKAVSGRFGSSILTPRLLRRWPMLMVALMPGRPARAVARQQSLETSYLAARDSASRSLIARVKAGEPYAKYIAVHDSVLESLEQRLRVIVGPVRAKGFPEPGRINLESLFPGDEDFGKLDALVFRSNDHKSSLWVTTRTLAAAWVKGHALPRKLETALHRPMFYTWGIERDAAVEWFGDVPVSDARQLDIAQAMMMTTAQDYVPGPPDELLVTVLRGTRVFIVRAPLAVIIPVPHRCTVMGDSATKRANLDEDGDLAYRKCYGQGVSGDSRFRRVVAQVRSIAAALP